MTDPKTASARAAALDGLLARAREVVAAMSPADRGKMIAVQRRGYVISEAAFGTDEDEAAYRAALVADDQPTIARLNAESAARAEQAAAWLKERGL